MTRFYRIAAHSIALLQSLVSAYDFAPGCLDGICAFTRADLTPEQVTLELGSQLSHASNVFGPRDPRWGNTTERYDPYMQPHIRMVVQPARESDVPKIVQYANSNGIPFLAVGRRHGMTASLSAFDGMQIDMGLLRDVTINPGGETAWFQGGAYAKEVIETLSEQGYVTTTGSTSCVGLLGPALGGGRGRLEGFYGLISDNFATLNVVLANGTAVTVSEESNPDLFWAMKGAGHNFGIVTSLEARIYPHPADSWYYKNYVWKQDKLETVFDELNKFHNNGTHAKEMAFNLGAYTIEPVISKTEAIIWWSFVYAGPQEDAQTHLTPFDNIEAVTTEDGNVPYTKVADVSGTGSESWLCESGLVHMHYSAGLQVWNATSQRQIYELFNRKIREIPAFARSAVVMEDYSHEGVAAIDPATSAYPWRDRSLLNFITVTYTPDSALDGLARDWARQTRDLWNQGQHHLLPSTYVNYAHGDESVESMYGYEPWRLEKLRSLKARYDPAGRFSYYNPITPAGQKQIHRPPVQGQVVLQQSV